MTTERIITTIFKLMDKYLKCLLCILSNATEPVIVVIKDVQAVRELQSASHEQGMLIKAKRIPYDYPTSKGYIWQHQNSREYELSI
jgi:hypothetical protein